MRTRLTTFWYVASAVAFAGVIVSLFAQATNGVPVPVDTAPLPQTKSEFWTFAIAFVSPLIVWGVSKIPDLPKKILPAITPLVGIGLGAGLKWLEAANLTWVDTAQAGALAVFIREVFNQWVTRPLMGTSEKTPSNPTVNLPGVELK